MNLPECTQCPHPTDHVMIATTEDVMNGGVLLCPSPGCLCLTTWGIGDESAARVPDDEELAELREQVQRQG